MAESMTGASTLTPFSDVRAGLGRQGEHFAIELPADWLQGRTAYGGLSAALCLEATLRTFPGLPPMRSAQFAYVGPAAGVLRITASMLRKGKSTAFTSADLTGEHGLAVRAAFAFGAERGLGFDYADAPKPTAPPPAECPDYFNWPHAPNFMRHFEGRLAAGAPPASPGARAEMLVWLRHRDETAGGGLVNLIALADALPPAALILMRERLQVSTMTWTVDMLDDDPTSPTGWRLVECVGETARHGYSAQRTTIWNPDGRPILVARQTIAIFAKG